MTQSSMPEYVACIILFCKSRDEFLEAVFFLLLLPRSTHQNYSLNINDFPPFAHACSTHCLTITHILSIDVYSILYTVYPKRKRRERKAKFHNEIEKTEVLLERGRKTA